MSADSPADSALRETLRAWRLAEAHRRKVPSFCVMSNRTMDGIVSARPRDERALLGIRGVGPKLISLYGQAILRLIDAPES